MSHGVLHGEFLQAHITYCSCVCGWVVQYRNITERLKDSGSASRLLEEVHDLAFSAKLQLNEMCLGFLNHISVLFTSHFNMF